MSCCSVCIVSFIRLHFLVVIYHTSSSDIAANVSAAIWSAVEVNVAIICASLPSLKACISRLFPRFFSTVDYTHTNTVSSKRGGGGGRSKSDFGVEYLENPFAAMGTGEAGTDGYGAKAGMGIKSPYSQRSFVRATKAPDNDIEMQVAAPGVLRTHRSLQSQDRQINVVTVVEHEYETKESAGESVRRGSDSESETYLFHQDGHDPLR